MVGETDEKDKSESRTLALAISALLIILIVAVALLLPELKSMIEEHFSPGLGLKDSAIISFFLSIVIMIVFAISAGDGLIGELQFILTGFFAFFLIIWLLIAWIF